MFISKRMGKGNLVSKYEILEMGKSSWKVLCQVCKCNWQCLIQNLYIVKGN